MDPMPTADKSRRAVEVAGTSSASAAPNRPKSRTPRLLTKCVPGPAGGAARRLSTSSLTIAVAAVLFAILAPLSADTYNTIFHRGFLDLGLRGNPYALAPHSSVSYHGASLSFDFPYPPLTLLLLLPAWAAYHLLHSEAAYQVFFKLPLFLSAVTTQLLAVRLAQRREPAGEMRLAAWYVLLPGVLLLTTIAGGFDAVSALLLLLAVYWYGERRRAASALALGAAGALRLFPLAALPVFLVHLWRTGRRRWRSLVSYSLLSAAPLVFSCTPFAAADPTNFFGFLEQGQSTYGPFSTLNVIAAPLRRLLAPRGYTINYQRLGAPFVLLTLVGVVVAYLWVAARPSSPAKDSLLVLLVFFLVYPKGHGLYITALIPLALIEPAGVAPWIWAPGALWMLTVNGALGGSGLPYWFAPVTGVWQRAVPEPVAGKLTVGLSAIQALLVTIAVVQIAQSTGRGLADCGAAGASNTGAGRAGAAESPAGEEDAAGV